VIDWALIVGLGLVLLTAFLRGLFMPTFSWDSVNYHLPMAASWVQEGGHFFWPSPGGWSFYQWFTSNGEVLVSWTMLGLRGDDLSGLVLFLPFFLVLFSSFALGRSLGLDRRQAGLVAALLSTPACYLQSLNTGEVDLTLYAFLLGGAVFAQYSSVSPEQHQRASILLTAAAWGTAAGTKILGLPALVVLAVWGIFLLLQKKTSPGIFLAAALVGAIPWAPWAIRSTLFSGSPLWPAPLTIGEHTIWPGDLELALTHKEFDAAAHGILATKTSPGKWLLQQYIILGPRNLGPLLLVAMILGPLGLLRGLTGRWRGLAPLLALALFELLIFFSPKLWSARVLYSYSYGRMLGFPAAIFLLLGFASLPLEVRRGPLIQGGLRLLLAAHLWNASPWGWYQLRSHGGFQVGLLVISLLLGWWLSRRGAAKLATLRAPRAGPPVVFLILILLAPSWRGIRDSLRFPCFLFEETKTLAYVVPSLQILDTPEIPRRLAVTAGERYFGISQHWAPYMGRRLQNTLRYVPITKDGRIVSYRNRSVVAAAAAPSAWLRRLLKGNFSHLVTLPFRTQEDALCQAMPHLFKQLTKGYFLVWEIQREALQKTVEELNKKSESSPRK
jgi:hypothetical protein